MGWVESGRISVRDSAGIIRTVVQMRENNDDRSTDFQFILGGADVRSLPDGTYVNTEMGELLVPITASEN